MASSSAKIPKRASSKKSQTEAEPRNSLEELELLQLRERNARKRIKPQIYEVETKRAIKKWKEEEGELEGNTTAWWSTPEALDLVEKLKATVYETGLFKKQAERIRRGGPLRRAWQALFNTSQVGLGVQKAGMGKRTRSEQSNFKQSLIDAYGAGVSHPKKPKVILQVYSSATGRANPRRHITAAHVVPHSLGPDLLIALFGINVQGELDTPYNSLLLDKAIEDAMDKGMITIVPDISDDPSPEEVKNWESAGTKEYKWRIIDKDADRLDELIKGSEGHDDMPIRDLDGVRLCFRTAQRPRARYLYFLFVFAQLRLHWRHSRNDPSKVLKSQLDKGFWATKGRYLKRSFLLALAEEIGHDTELLDNVPMEPGDDEEEEEPDETGLVGLAGLIRSRKRGFEDEDGEQDNEEDDEDDEEGGDGDEDKE